MSKIRECHGCYGTRIGQVLHLLIALAVRWPVLLGRMPSIPVWEPLFKSQVGWKNRCFTAIEGFAAVILIVVLSPVLLATCIAVLVLSGRSPLIAHKCIGQNKSDLWILRIRAMWDGRTRWRLRDPFSIEYMDDQVGPHQKSRNDARVRNAFTHFCRRHSFDELPQLVNLLAGEMSLVGPRPVTSPELTQIYGADAEEILSVKPGLSDLWQISGRNRLSIPEGRRYDLQCVRTRSTRMYLRILTKTLPVVFTGENAW